MQNLGDSNPGAEDPLTAMELKAHLEKPTLDASQRSLRIQEANSPSRQTKGPRTPSKFERLRALSSAGVEIANPTPSRFPALHITTEGASIARPSTLPMLSTEATPSTSLPTANEASKTTIRDSPASTEPFLGPAHSLPAEEGVLLSYARPSLLPRPGTPITEVSTEQSDEQISELSISAPRSAGTANVDVEDLDVSLESAHSRGEVESDMPEQKGRRESSSPSGEQPTDLGYFDLGSTPSNIVYPSYLDIHTEEHAEGGERFANEKIESVAFMKLDDAEPPSPSKLSSTARLLQKHRLSKLQSLNEGQETDSDDELRRRIGIGPTSIQFVPYGDEQSFIRRFESQRDDNEEVEEEKEEKEKIPKIRLQRHPHASLPQRMLSPSPMRTPRRLTQYEESDEEEVEEAESEGKFLIVQKLSKMGARLDKIVEWIEESRIKDDKRFSRIEDALAIVLLQEEKEAGKSEAKKNYEAKSKEIKQAIVSTLENEEGLIPNPDDLVKEEPVVDRIVRKYVFKSDVSNEHLGEQLDRRAVERWQSNRTALFCCQHIVREHGLEVSIIFFSLTIFSVILLQMAAIIHQKSDSMFYS